MVAPDHQSVTATNGSLSPLLQVSGLRAGYGGRVVLHGVDVRVAPGEVVGMLGHNGAGKTTLLKAILGAVSPAAGEVEFDGASIAKASPVKNARRGIVMIPAEHFVFADLTVSENLLLAGSNSRSKSRVEQRLDRVHDIFPILRERVSQRAGTLSGGQQRMLGIGIALMAEPRLLLLDEPSLGLAPTLVQQMMAVIGRLAREEGLSVLLVEQNVKQTLEVVDRAYFMRSGRIIHDESVEALRERTSYWDLF